jgi:hypothetical protein
VGVGNRRSDVEERAAWRKVFIVGVAMMLAVMLGIVVTGRTTTGKRLQMSGIQLDCFDGSSRIVDEWSLYALPVLESRR